MFQEEVDLHHLYHVHSLTILHLERLHLGKKEELIIDKNNNISSTARSFNF